MMRIGLGTRVFLWTLVAMCVPLAAALASLNLGIPVAAVIGFGAAVAVVLLVVRTGPAAHVQRLLGQMAEAARKLAEGDWTVRIELPAGGDGLVTLAESFNEAAESLSASATELGEERRTLQSSQRALITAEKLAGIGHLAAGVAHEFNNLLAVITGHAQLALQSLEGHKEGDYVRRILDTSLRAADVSRRLLAFARPSDPRLHPVDLRKCIDNTMALAETHLRRNQIEVCATMPDHPVIARVDPRQIEQILLNLVLNAVDAMGESGRLSVTLHWPEEAEEAPHAATIEVTDTGAGIPAENLDRIFEPFFTTKGAFGTRGKVGTGLGLAVVSNLVEAHGGTVEVESHLGVGSTFRVALPIDVEASKAQPEIPSEATEEENIGSMCALVADREEGMRLLLGAILSAEGHRVSYAANPADILKALAEDPIELLLLEIGMPGLDGSRIQEAIQDRKEAPIIIAISTGAAPEEETQWMERGAAVCLRKPFGISELKAALRRLCPRPLEALTE